MPYTPHKISTIILSLIAGIFFIFLPSISQAVNPTQGIAEHVNTTNINLTNLNSSSTHNYDWIRLVPSANYDDPSCPSSANGEDTRGMLSVDSSGQLYVCGANGWQISIDPWKQAGNNVYPKQFSTSQVAIGQDIIGSPTVKLILSQATSGGGRNNMYFQPSDGFGNNGIEMTTSGTVSGAVRASTFIDFKVGERGANWDGRILYHYSPAFFTGLRFYAKRKDGLVNPANSYPDLSLWANGNVDFGSDVTDSQVVPRTSTRKVKVYGDTEAQKLILGSNGLNFAELKVSYDASSGGGYYASYAP